ncbi:transcriptional repressor [Aerococcus sp. JJEM-2022c]|uniref:Fur family transcriptional regulator n=1 Tax=Aerococcus sp. Group 2 TaxID=2976811 RepID=UPI00227C4922|nr:Fur family transcriptional regulator [Aerococcus sp. Group 2]MCY3041993.1 transcriptional repressor [Aerococcus sp. Group 2]
MDYEQLYVDAVAYLRERRIRLTSPRKKILKHLIVADHHPTAEQVYQELSQEDQSVSLATVYNTLNIFTDINLVKEVRANDGATHFDFFLKKHYHIICQNCGKIVDVYYPDAAKVEQALTEVEDYAVEATQFEITGYHLEFYGICSDCQGID